MKLLPSLSRSFPFKGKLVLSIFLMTAISFYLFLVSGFSIDLDLPERLKYSPPGTTFVKLKGEVIGVLDVESNKLFASGEKDRRFLTQLTSQGTMVLESFRLF